MSEALQGYEHLQRRLHAISGPQATAGLMRTIGLAAIREQKLLVQRKTGITGRSVHLADVTATTALTLAAGAARFLEDGTRAHDITPNAKKALRWAASSSTGFRLTGSPRKGSSVGWAFAKVVHHPGTKAHPFMLPGAQLAVSKSGALDKIIVDWNKA